MSAEPISAYVTPPWQPDPIRQKLRNYTLEDVLDLPDGAPRMELVHGRILPLTPPTLGHQRVARRICRWLEDNAPPDRYSAELALGVGISIDQGREPDVLLVDPNVELTHHYLSPREVTLVIEITSPSTKRVDRFEKLVEYADVGIPHYWRVELEPHVHIYAYERGDNGRYELVADSGEMLELDRPFSIKLAIAEIVP